MHYVFFFKSTFDVIESHIHFEHLALVTEKLPLNKSIFVISQEIRFSLLFRPYWRILMFKRFFSHVEQSCQHRFGESVVDNELIP